VSRGFINLRARILKAAAIAAALIVVVAGVRAIRHHKVENVASPPALKGSATAPTAQPVTASSGTAPVSETHATTSTATQAAAAPAPEPDATDQDGNALVSIVDSQLADFREGITLGQWIGTRDQSENWQPSDDKAGFVCRTFTSIETLPSGLQVTRMLYFYPPDAPTPAVLPEESGQGLINQTCQLAEVRVHVPTTVERNGHFFEQTLQKHLDEKYGARMSLKGIRYRFEKESAGWQANPMEIITTYEPQARGNDGASMAAVEVFARLPAARDDEERPDHVLKMYRHRAIENDQFHRSVAIAAVDATLTDRVSKLFESLFAASATTQGPSEPSSEQLRGAVLPALTDWLGATKGLSPPRRAAALYVADQLLVTASRWNEPEWSEKDNANLRSDFEKLGAQFTYYDPDGCYEYLGNWLNEARELDPNGTIGQMSVLVALARDTPPTIAGNLPSGTIRTAVSDGEWLLSKNPDAATAAQIHFMIGDAYSDMVALAGGADPDYAESFTQQEGEAAREKALQHYRLALTVDSTSENAKDAWLQAWHLRAGLLPETRFVFDGD
jgi:hypothetical protein